MNPSLEQARLVQALCDPAHYPHPAEASDTGDTFAAGEAVGHVEHMETHISHILLAGDFAYKIKKPIDLGFLDFSTLEKRRFYCEEELRLNRRLAPQLYLEVTPIHGSSEVPRLGAEQPGPIIEYAVKMRRFPQDGLFERMAACGNLREQHIDALADVIANFHAGIARADADSPYGSAAAIEAPMRQNFAQIRQLLSKPEEHAALDRLEAWSRREHARCAEFFETRRSSGHVRECHGDLHLGNVVWLAETGTAQPFDCIEFNPNLRWIDVISEIAFVVMDLHAHGLPTYANRFLDGWLERSGDFGGLTLLNYYLVYRAMVRAKIARIRAEQADLDAAARQAALTDYAAYIALAQRFSAPRQRALLIMHGLSGSGKSRLAQALGEQLALVRIRSDVERKRMHGLTPLAHSGSDITGGIYSSQSTLQTYAALTRLTRQVLAAGWPVVVDACFLRREQRAPLRALAEECGVPFVIVACGADNEVLRQRVARRMALGKDASEADLKVLEQQLSGMEVLDEPSAANEARVNIDTAQQTTQQAVELVAKLLAERSTPAAGALP